MTTTLLKQNISKVINSIEDKNFLEAVYTIVSEKSVDAPFELNDSIKKELDKRKPNHKKGISTSHTWQAIKKSALSQKNDL